MPPWRLEPHGRTLRIDLVTWLEGSEWERLFDGITQEIASVDRVTFVVPQEGPATAQLLLSPSSRRSRDEGSRWRSSAARDEVGPYEDVDVGRSQAVAGSSCRHIHAATAASQTPMSDVTRIPAGSRPG